MHKKQNINIHFNGFTKINIGTYSQSCLKNKIVIYHANKSLGEISLCHNNEIKIKNFPAQVLTYTTLQVILFFATALVLYFLIRKKFLSPLKKLALDALKTDCDLRAQNSEEASEIKALAHTIQELKEKITLKVKSQTQAEVSTQLSHDIKSPLAALDMIIPEITQLPEAQRSIIRDATQRIHDITENLLEKNTVNTEKEQVINTHMLTTLITPLLAEKRTQYRENSNLKIEANITKKIYGAFVKVNSTEFKELLSRLLDHLIQSINFEGQIIITPVTKNTHVLIEITNYLSEPCKEAFPQGGVPSKKKTSVFNLKNLNPLIKSWGGTLSITSAKAQESLITITLPLRSPPPWFLKKLQLQTHRDIIILDDDTSIHQVWDKHLSQIINSQKDIRIHHFNNCEQVRTWFKSKSNSKTYTYLFDYEILGDKSTGLDLIEELNINKNSILVTSHYQEQKILERCEKLNVPLLPKNLVIYAPISFPCYQVTKAILLDDDKLIHLAWQMQAKKNDIKLTTYSSTTELLKDISNIDKSTPIYIDSNLGEEISGEDFAKALFKQGYTELYIASGYNPTKFNQYDFLKGIVGKRPPWN